MDQRLDLAERPSLDHLDQRAHPGMKLAGQLHRFGRSGAALCRMFRRAAFGGVDHLTAEQLLPLAGQIHRPGLLHEPVDQGIVQMRLGQIEPDARLLDGQGGHARLGVVCKKLLQGRARLRLQKLPIAAHYRPSQDAVVKAGL